MTTNKTTRTAFAWLEGILFVAFAVIGTICSEKEPFK
jgi:hypothetical protein